MTKKINDQQEALLEALRGVLKESSQVDAITKADLDAVEKRIKADIDAAASRLKADLTATENRLMHEIHLVRDDIKDMNNRVHTLERAA